MDPTPDEKLAMIRQIHARSERLAKKYTDRASALFAQQLHGHRMSWWAALSSKRCMDNAAFHHKIVHNAEKYMRQLGLPDQEA